MTLLTLLYHIQKLNSVMDFECCWCEQPISRQKFFFTAISLDAHNDNIWNSSQNSASGDNIPYKVPFYRQNSHGPWGFPEPKRVQSQSVLGRLWQSQEGRGVCTVQCWETYLHGRISRQEFTVSFLCQGVTKNIRLPNCEETWSRQRVCRGHKVSQSVWS